MDANLDRLLRENRELKAAFKEREISRLTVRLKSAKAKVAELEKEIAELKRDDWSPDLED